MCSAAEIVAAPVCGDGPDHAPTAGIAAATASLNALWQRRPHGWLVSYSLKGDVEQKPAPFRLPQSQPSKSAEPSVDVIKGLLFVTELRCRVYEINPPKAFVLQIEGRNFVSSRALTAAGAPPSLPDCCIHSPSARSLVAKPSGWCGQCRARALRCRTMRYLAGRPLMPRARQLTGSPHARAYSEDLDTGTSDVSATGPAPSTPPRSRSIGLRPRCIRIPC